MFFKLLNELLKTVIYFVVFQWEDIGLEVLISTMMMTWNELVNPIHQCHTVTYILRNLTDPLSSYAWWCGKTLVFNGVIFSVTHRFLMYANSYTVKSVFASKYYLSVTVYYLSWKDSHYVAVYNLSFKYPHCATVYNLS